MRFSPSQLPWYALAGFLHSEHNESDVIRVMNGSPAERYTRAVISRLPANRGEYYNAVCRNRSARSAP